MSTYLSVKIIIPYILLGISLIIWALIPFRQYRGSFFLFFLILALSDPIVLIYHAIVPIHPFRIYIVVFLFTIYSIMNFETVKKRLAVLIILAALDICFAVYAGIFLLRVILFFEDFVILYLILGKTLSNITRTYAINVFYFVLNFYVLTLLIKDFIVLIDVKTGIYYFYITSALEILISIYFVFYNDKNSFRYKFKSV